jgi:hypothetical protein
MWENNVLTLVKPFDESQKCDTNNLELSMISIFAEDHSEIAISPQTHFHSSSQESKSSSSSSSSPQSPSSSSSVFQPLNIVQCTLVKKAPKLGRPRAERKLLHNIRNAEQIERTRSSKRKRAICNTDTNTNDFWHLLKLILTDTSQIDFIIKSKKKNEEDVKVLLPDECLYIFNNLISSNFYFLSYFTSDAFTQVKHSFSFTKSLTGIVLIFYPFIKNERIKIN